jgi:hypothetical protein
MTDKGFAWDYLKMMIRSDTMFYSGSINKIRKANINNLENKLRKLEMILPDSLNENTNLEIETIKLELEQINKEKTRASIFRSKCNWSEHGEQNSKFFLNLEKYNYTNKTISKLEIVHIDKDNEVIETENEINEHIKDYYEKLYSKIECNSQLLEDISVDLPK